MKHLFFVCWMAFFGMSFLACAQVPEKKKKLASADLSGLSQATFASGCFWCVEGVYESVKGVEEAVNGYAGGTSPNPTYDAVSAGRTDHAETVNVYYHPSIVSYETLLQVYFASQNPTQVNGQGPDKGRQYRSIIFYRNQKEKEHAEKFINRLNASGKYDKPIAAEVKPLTKFWTAEDYHQDYIYNNPGIPYVQQESIPRIKRFQKQLPQLIKEGYRY